MAFSDETVWTAPELPVPRGSRGALHGQGGLHRTATKTCRGHDVGATTGDVGGEGGDCLGDCDGQGNFVVHFLCSNLQNFGMMCVYFVIWDDMMLPMCKGPQSFCLGGGGLNTLSPDKKLRESFDAISMFSPGSMAPRGEFFVEMNWFRRWFCHGVTSKTHPENAKICVS